MPRGEAEHFHAPGERSLQSPLHSRAEAQRLGSGEGPAAVGDADGWHVKPRLYQVTLVPYLGHTTV